MGRTWNENWPEIWDEGAPAEYAASLRRLCIASIDWIEAHPKADLHWKERDMKALAEAAGLPEDTELSDIAFVGFWSDFVRPSNAECEAWFNAIVNACSNGKGEDAEPSFFMMQKGMATGLMVQRYGWEHFDDYMMNLHSKGKSVH